MTRALVKTISWVHILCIVYLLFGFLSPLPLLIFHLLAIPAVIMQWRMNNNQCVLTQLQKKVEALDKNASKELEGNFTKELFLKWGIILTDKQLLFVIYGLLISSWCVSFSRFILIPA